MRPLDQARTSYHVDACGMERRESGSASDETSAAVMGARKGLG